MKTLMSLPWSLIYKASTAETVRSDRANNDQHHLYRNTKQNVISADMEPVPTGRVLLVGLILSHVLAPSPGAATPMPSQRSLPRSWKTGNLLGLAGGKQMENSLQLVPGWDPSGSLHDWIIEMMSSFPILRELPDSWWIPALRRRGWFAKFPIDSRNHDGQSHTALMDGAGLTRVTLGKSWSSDWLEPSTNEEVKRSIVVADDVAFREKSKFLTAMQRQKWLNSVMRKLVINKK
ncbi:tuberoinfundibular peptide of 39 residues [Scyliorhinus canicula]|uniref:tuberoinfundibular peptide of 39 residues n=1 Tax=Scyliorhinus canicula TaxID=7830 RepID=UPI0018F31CF0|nr:tuberoinfundibular peptide of 39 residues [Scyliorhinus canicula]